MSSSALGNGRAGTQNITDSGDFSGVRALYPFRNPQPHSPLHLGDGFKAESSEKHLGDLTWLPQGWELLQGSL